MPKYRATFNRIESRVIPIYCNANSLEEAELIFDDMVLDPDDIPDFDTMTCVHAEEYLQDIEEVKE